MNPIARWWQRRRLADPRWRALFETYRGDDVIALDLETTGLDPAGAEILSIAAVPVQGRRVRVSSALALTVRGTQRIELDSMRHHRLRADDLAAGVPLAEALEQWLVFVGNRPLLGYCVDFDLAVLDRDLGREFGFRLPNRRIDLGHAYERVWRGRHPEREPPGLSFDAIAADLGVPVVGRHDALGDAVATGLCWLLLS